MQVRGAPLIGATAAYGVCLALRADPSDEALERACRDARRHAPTAINLKWALDEMAAAVRNRPRDERLAAAYRRAAEICDEDVAINQAIGRHGAELIAGDRRQEEAGRAGARAHPLQRRLARDRGFRHRARADLRGARRGRGAPCLGRRDAPAQPGRRAHRLGARPARRAAHRDPGQYRRPPDAARHGRHGDRGGRPGDRQRRRLQQDRHLSQGARRQGQRRAVLCGAAVADHRFLGVGRARRDSDRAAQRGRGRDHDRPHRRRPHRDRADRARTARPSPTTAST